MPILSTFLKQSSLTYSDIEKDCYDYINSLPAGSKPKDFFDGSEGKIIVDYLAAFHSDMAYKLLVAFCENFLIYSNKIENVIANAESKGFNALRGNNATLQITFTPSTSTLVGYLDNVGTVGEYGLYSLESKYIKQGEESTINVVIGAMKSSNIVVTDTSAIAYRFTTQNVSDHIKVLIDDKPVEIATDPFDFIHGKLITMTNTFGSIDVLDFSGLSKTITGYTKPDYDIITGTNITLNYIELDNIVYNGVIGSFILGDILVDASNNSRIVQTSIGNARQSINLIQENTILYQQTKNRVVARRDAKKLTKQYLGYALSTNDVDYGPSIIAVSYVLDTHLPLNSSQLIDLNAYLSEHRAFGIPMPLIVGSNKVIINLDVVLTTTSTFSTTDLQNIVTNVFNKYANSCGAILDFAALENEIEEVEGIQTVRFRPKIVQYDPIGYVTLGTIIQQGYDCYIAAKYLYKTGATQPTWNTTIDGLTYDNEIVWKTIRRIPADEWSANLPVEVGQVFNGTSINNISFQVYEQLHVTGAQAPTGPGYNGAIYLSETFFDPTKSNWAANIQMNYGDEINISGNTENSYICSGFRKVSGQIDTWTIVDDAIYTAGVKFLKIPMSGEYIDKSAVIELPWDSYALFNLTIQ